MIIIPKAQLKFLLAGRTLTIHTPPRQRPYEKARDYAIGLTHREAICRVEILDVTPTADGIQLKVRQITIDKPRLLAARSEYGYTTNPHLALRDEPEAVTGHALERMAKEGRDRDKINEMMRQGEVPLPERVRALEHAAADGDQQAKRDLFMTQKHLRDAEKRGRRAA